jgi:hypothetical protein
LFCGPERSLDAVVVMMMMVVVVVNVYTCGVDERHDGVMVGKEVGLVDV